MKKRILLMGFGISIAYTMNSYAVIYKEYCSSLEDNRSCFIEEVDEVAEFAKPKQLISYAPSGESVHKIKSLPGKKVVIALYTDPNFTGTQTLVFKVHPKHGHVTEKDNMLDYTPNPDFVGEDSFTYELIDKDKTSTSTVNLVIKRRDHSDEVDPSQKEIYREVYDAHAEPKLPSIFDIGNEYDPTTQQLILEPSFGSQLIDNKDGTLIYYPNPNLKDAFDSFTYTIVDPDGKKKTFFVRVEVGIVTEEQKVAAIVKMSEPVAEEEVDETPVIAAKTPDIEEPVVETKTEVETVVETKIDVIDIEVVEVEQQTVVVPYHTIDPSAYVDHYTTVIAGNLQVIDIRTHMKHKRQIVTINPSVNSQVKYSKNGTLIYVSNPGFLGVDMFSYTVSERQKETSSTYTVKVAVEEKPNANLILPASCQAYAVHDNYMSDSQIFTINASDGVATGLGSLKYGLDIEGMAIHLVTGDLYAVSGSGQGHLLDGFLYRVDAQTGELTVIGDTGFSELTALAFRSDGTLWAWSGNGTKKSGNRIGVIQIDPDTAQSQPHSTPSWASKKRKVEGLAWSIDGSVLYASENNNLWEWNCGHFRKICSSNFPRAVEALETLADGMLLFAADNHGTNTAYVYNPETCTVVLERPFKTDKNYSDVEAIAWPLKCQFSSEIGDWEVKFGSTETEKEVCLETAQTFDITGTVTITPPESLGYIDTYWHIPNTEEGLLSSTMKLGLAANRKTDCNTVFPQKLQTITGGTTTFNIKGQWQGLSSTNQDTLIKTHYGVNLYSREHTLLSTHEGILDLKGANVCDNTSPSP